MLLCKRRDTYEYFHLVVGRYRNDSELKTLIEFISPKERKRLQTYSFEELWDDLWVNKFYENYTKRVAEARVKFERNRDRIMTLIDAISHGFVRSKYDRRYRWGFPKGKPNPGEMYIKCALREFSEETRIPHQELSSALPTESGRRVIEPIKMTWTGTDGQRYTYYFWVFVLTRDLPEPERVPVASNIRTSSFGEEIEKLRWVSIEGLFRLLTTEMYAVFRAHYEEHISPFLVREKPINASVSKRPSSTPTDRPRSPRPIWRCIRSESR